MSGFPVKTEHDEALAARGSTETEHVAPPPRRRDGVVGWCWYYDFSRSCSRGCGRVAFVAVERWSGPDFRNYAFDNRPEGWRTTDGTYGTLACPKCQAAG